VPPCLPRSPYSSGTSRTHRHHVDGANSFEVVDWMMQESLDLLVNKNADRLDVQHRGPEGVRARLRARGNRARQVPAGIPDPRRPGVHRQPINRRHTTVTCNQIFGIDFDWDSFEKAVKMERGEEVLRREYLDPAMAQLNQEIESRAALGAKNNVSTIVGVLGTDPTTSMRPPPPRAEARRARLPGRQGPRHVRDALDHARAEEVLGRYFNPVTDIAKQFRTGIVGSGDGFDWYESVSLYQHTAGTWAGAVTVNGANQTGTR
jgi:hypothetical protein